VSNEDILDLEVSMDHWRCPCMKILHSPNHPLSNPEFHRPLNLYAINEQLMLMSTAMIVILICQIIIQKI